MHQIIGPANHKNVSSYLVLHPCPGHIFIERSRRKGEKKSDRYFFLLSPARIYSGILPLSLLTDGELMFGDRKLAIYKAAS